MHNLPVAILRLLAPVFLLASIHLAAQEPVSVQGIEWSRREPFTELKIRASATAGEIMGVEFWGSSITRWVDDKGTDFGSKAEGQPSNYETVWYSSTSGGGDRRSLEIVLSAKKAPDPGAAVMQAEGVLHMRYGTKKKSGEAKIGALAEGTKFRVPPFEFVVKKAATSGERTELLLEAVAPRDVDPKGIEEVRFVDGAGNPVSTSTSSYSSFAYGDEQTRTHRYSYQLRGGAPASVRYVVWEDLAERKIPFKVEVAKARSPVP